MFGKDIGGSSKNNDRRQNQNQQRQHDERIGSRQRNSDNPHPWLHPIERIARSEIVDTGVSKFVYSRLSHEMATPTKHTRGRGRPRDEAARLRILKAALDLMDETAFAQVTAEAIAERAGRQQSHRLPLVAQQSGRSDRSVSRSGGPRTTLARHRVAA